MNEYLMRDAAPFDETMWEKIDGMVVMVAKKNLVGRRLLEMVGPLGWGVEQAPLSGFAFEEGADAAVDSVTYLPLRELGQEFLLKAKHMAIAEKTPFDLDLGAVAIAATKLAKAEDEHIMGELLANAGCRGDLGDWDTLGGPFKATAMATAKLQAAGYDAPYAMVLSPGMYARLASLLQQGRREVELVEKLIGAGLFQSTSLPDDQVIVVSPQAWNLDLVVGQDIVTGYLGNEGLDQRFRVFETLALRIKRPGAICVLK